MISRLFTHFKVLIKCGENFLFTYSGRSLQNTHQQLFPMALEFQLPHILALELILIIQLLHPEEQLK